MFKIDRYIGMLFVRVVLICFTSLAGLYVVIDFMSNFEEFNTLGRKLPGGLPGVVFAYYQPRVLRFFDYTAGLLAMVAGVFAVTWLQRTQELTAMMAAGISHGRAVLPVVVGAILLACLGIVNREILLPRYSQELARSAQDWLGTSSQQCRQVIDAQTLVTISGQALYLADRRIEEPQIRLPQELKGPWGRQISGKNALCLAADEDHEAGILIQGVKTTEKWAPNSSAKIDDRVIIMTPTDFPWLHEDELFLASNVPFDQFQMSTGTRSYLSTWEMVRGLRNPSLDVRYDIQVAMHARLLQPLLDLTLILIGIPLILTQSNRNVFVAAFSCLGMVAGFYVVILGSHWAGNNYLLSPVLAAWLPLILFAPLAYTTVRMIWIPVPSHRAVAATAIASGGGGHAPV